MRRPLLQGISKRVRVPLGSTFPLPEQRRVPPFCRRVLPVLRGRSGEVHGRYMRVFECYVPVPVPSPRPLREPRVRRQPGVVPFRRLR